MLDTTNICVLTEALCGKSKEQNSNGKVHAIPDSSGGQRLYAVRPNDVASLLGGSHISLAVLYAGNQKTANKSHTLIYIE